MGYEDDLIRERIKQIIHREALSERAFAMSINKPASNLYRILSGERGIPNGFINSVLKAYPRVRKDWLTFGEGKMYVDDEEKEDAQMNTRPRLPKSMAEGHIYEYINGPKRALCQEKPIVTQFSDYDFSLILKNTRMSPKYDRGDELFFKKSNIIEWGNDYLVDTDEGPKFKKIIDEGDCIRCVPYNKDEFPDFHIQKNLINGYYRCVGVLRIF